MFESVLDRFAQRAPAAVLFRGLLARVFSDREMDRVFRENKERQVESELLFSTMIRLLTRVVVGGKKSVNASYMDMKDEVGVSSQALYDKLAGVELSVSEGLVRVPVVELMRILKKTKIVYDDPVPGYHAFVIDGKRLDGTEHRLKETRRISNAPLPGTALAMLDLRHRLFVDVAFHEDGHICERKVVKSMLDRLQPGALYIQDRNFSDGPLVECFLKAEAFFITRQHKRSPAWQPRGALEKQGLDANGASVFEQQAEVRLPDGSWVPVRRIVVKLTKPTRSKDVELTILTNLPDDAPAVTVANGYARRWRIETCLEHLAQALNAEIKTLAYPRAALLSFAVALTVFNVITTLETMLVQCSKNKDRPKLSKYYLASEIAEAIKGLDIMTTDADWRKLATLSLPSFYAWAHSVARHANLDKYASNYRSPKRPPPRRRQVNRSTHISTHKLLLKRQQG